MVAVDFSEKFKRIVDLYNERKEKETLNSTVLEEFSDEVTVKLIDLYKNLKKESESHKQMGIDLEVKSFYDILKSLAHKYQFEYPEDRLISLAEQVKNIVDDKVKYTDWNKRADIKAELKADLIVCLAENDYLPVDRDEVYKEIFEQAENFKKNMIVK